jgi:hypothetical protein
MALSIITSIVAALPTKPNVGAQSLGERRSTDVISTNGVVLKRVGSIGMCLPVVHWSLLTFDFSISRPLFS